MKITKLTFEKIFNYVKLFTLFSIFTWIIYQYISIKWNIAFFSYTKVINDSILAIPMVIVYLLSFYLSYHYIDLFIKYSNKYKLSKWLSTTFWIVINIWIPFFMYKYIVYEVNILTTNNVIALFITFIYLFLIINIFSHILIYLYDKKFIKILYLFLWFFIYIFILSNISNIIYKNLCIKIEDKNIHVNYFNDQFIFIDNWNIIKLDEINWFLRLENCENVEK